MVFTVEVRSSGRLQSSGSMPQFQTVPLVHDL